MHCGQAEGSEIAQAIQARLKGWVLTFSIFYDYLEQELYRQGGNCCKVCHDPTQNTNRGNVIKGGDTGQEEDS